MRADAKLFRVLVCIVLLATIVSPIFNAQNAKAADQITQRSLTLKAGGVGGAGDAGAKVSGNVRHDFSFTLPSTGNTSVGSIKFEYCTTASEACTVPTGLSLAGATQENETGATGFITLTKPSAGVMYISRASAVSVPANTPVSYRFDGVINPSITDPTKMTFFVRISTYASTDTTGIPIDAGTVAASTSTQIVLSGTMPESLVFCAARTITAIAPDSIPDCSSATESAVTFNQLFSPTDTATATSQMAASTNATGGYSITVNGPTLKSGSNEVAPMSSRLPGARGTGQFGLNLKLNTTATSTLAVGAELSLASNGTDRKGAATANYNVVDEFKFTTGESVATSSGATNAQIYTVSYIVNVPGSQTAGLYTTTLTYICTPTF